jgi:hypothetical protein
VLQSKSRLILLDGILPGQRTKPKQHEPMRFVGAETVGEDCFGHKSWGASHSDHSLSCPLKTADDARCACTRVEENPDGVHNTSIILEAESSGVDDVSW